MKTKKIHNKVCYACEVCGFAYSDKQLAEQCEAYCREHHACNTDITKHAVNYEENGSGEEEADAEDDSDEE